MPFRKMQSSELVLQYLNQDRPGVDRFGPFEAKSMFILVSHAGHLPTSLNSRAEKGPVTD